MRTQLSRGIVAVSSLVVIMTCSVTSEAGATEKFRIDPRIRLTIERLDRGATPAEFVGRFPISRDGNLDVFIEADASEEELAIAGARVRTRVGNLFTAFIPPDRIDEVASLPSVKRIVGTRFLQPALDVSVPAIGVAVLRGMPPEFDGANGTGIVIGVIDEGIDFDHPDFQQESGATRFLGIWDQFYGREWSAAEIDAGVCTEVDSSRHGTVVMGVAAGDGSGTGNEEPAFQYVGVAPMADLVGVKIDTWKSTTHVSDGIRYVFDVAGQLGRPAVANLSAGYILGPHDGTSVFEAMIDSLLGPGRVFVAAAHNWRDLPWHAEVLSNTSPGVATLVVNSSQPGASIQVDGYYDVGSSVDLRIVTPSGISFGPYALGTDNYPLGQSTPDGTVYAFHGMSWSLIHPEVNLYVEVGPGQNANGIWRIEIIRSNGANTVETDFWVAPESLSAVFDQGLAINDEMVSEPANAFGAIAVGGWNTKFEYIACNGDTISSPPFVGEVGELSPLSNAGPSRDGRVKPDIVAPGGWIGSTLTLDLPVECPPAGTPTGVLPDGLHRASVGTSVAAPHVAGACALLMQHLGPLTAADLRGYFEEHSTVDGYTDAVPNDDWGYGKLHLHDFVASVIDDVRSSFSDVAVSPNPSLHQFLISASVQPGRSPTVEIVDAGGRRVANLVTSISQGQVEATWDGRNENGERVAPGVYFARVRDSHRVGSTRLTLLP